MEMCGRGCPGPGAAASLKGTDTLVWGLWAAACSRKLLMACLVVTWQEAYGENDKRVGEPWGLRGLEGDGSLTRHRVVQSG